MYHGFKGAARGVFQLYHGNTGFSMEYLHGYSTGNPVEYLFFFYFFFLFFFL